MKASAVSAVAIAAAPSFGPAIVTLFGVEIPIVAFALSLVALGLARMVAKRPRRRLTWRQEAAVTILLGIFLFLLVTGSFGNAPLGRGMAFAWGLGVGLSGILFLELFGDYVMAVAKSFLLALRNGGDKPVE